MTLDRRVELSAIVYLAGTSARMITENRYAPQAEEAEKATALLPRLGEAREAPIQAGQAGSGDVKLWGRCDGNPSPALAFWQTRNEPPFNHECHMI